MFIQTPFPFAMMVTSKRKKKAESGRLRIGDDWNAITIIALSQNNPLKAVAEFVENSIDAGARNVTVIRGRERGGHYLEITDDGTGIPKNGEGQPNFRYVATHICDSIKRRLKTQGVEGIQGEFGIGLLSFWTVGEALRLTSAGADGKTYTMHMSKGDPGYTVVPRRTLFPMPGTQLKVAPLLAGIRQLSGEKIQWYLASELRERIRQSGVRITVIDRQARKEFKVEPRKYTGRLLHQLPAAATGHGEIYVELYLAEPDVNNHVALYRSGTRIVADIAELDAFAHAPWNSGSLQGIVDAAFVNLTPATRTGVVQDAAFAAFLEALAPVENTLAEIIEEQRRAEDERASRQTLRTIQKAFKEALLALPAEEYDWFEVHDRRGLGTRPNASIPGAAVTDAQDQQELETGATEDDRQKQFFEYAGPLFRVRISPASCVLPVRESRTLRALARDRSGKLIDEGLQFAWTIIEGEGTFDNDSGEIVTFNAPAEPGLMRVGVTVTQGEMACEAEAMITVTDSLLPEMKEPSAPRQGLPSYTFQRAPGELWRSRYDSDQNVIVINNGHRDFVFASKKRALKLRYICQLFAKELVYKNFPGLPADQLLERLIELSLYTEENLR